MLAIAQLTRFPKILMCFLLLETTTMKRKEVHIEEDERDSKRIKLDELEEPVEALNADVVQQIFKSLGDREFIRCARVCKTWNRASIRERSRFIDQRIAGLKMSFGSKTKEPSEFANMFQEIWDYHKNELASLTKLHADWLKELKRTDGISTIERFNIWLSSPMPKNHFPSPTEVAPKGSKSIFDMYPLRSDNGFYKDHTFVLDKVLEIIEEDLGVTVQDLEEYDPVVLERARKILGNNNNAANNDEDADIDLNECKKLMALERYLEHIMELNFGSFINVW